MPRTKDKPRRQTSGVCLHGPYKRQSGARRVSFLAETADVLLGFWSFVRFQELLAPDLRNISDR